MNKMILFFTISVSVIYSSDPARLPMQKIGNLHELCHCGVINRVIAYTTTRNCFKEGAFILETDKEVNYGIITYSKQKSSSSYPRYQIILKIFKKMDAESFECSLGHPYDKKIEKWSDELNELFESSNLTMRFATESEREELQLAMDIGLAKLSYDLPSYQKLARNCLRIYLKDSK